MKQTVWIILRARISREGLPDEESVQRVPGFLEEDGPLWRLTYREPEESGMGGSQTELALSPRRAALRRSGSNRCELLFEENARHTSFYETPFARLTAEVETQSLRTRLSAGGGVAELRYRMCLEGLGESEHVLRVLVREREAPVPPEQDKNGAGQK